MASGEEVVREFIRSFNERDLDGFEVTLDPEVELNSMKGLVKGVPAARAWATRVPGGVQQTVVVEKIETAGDEVLATIRRDWHWDEDGSHASTDDMAWLFRVRGGRVLTWTPFENRDEARAAFAERAA